MAYLSLTQTVPLRSTLEWGQYGDVQSIPQVYGQCRLTPLKYDQQGLVWALADHAVMRVDGVTRDDADVAFSHTNTLDSSEHPIALIELDSPLVDGERLAATVTGKADPKTGQLLQNPALIVWDFLANVCGQPLLRADVDAFRAECEAAGLSANWMVNNPQQTIRSSVEQLMNSIGARWSPYSRGLARLWPPLS